jgi:hypothetical protein
MKEEIKLLLEKKERDEELDRLLVLYGKINDAIKRGTYDSDEMSREMLLIKAFPVCLPVPVDFLNKLNRVRPTCGDLLHALSDYYEKKILEHTIVTSK